MLAELPDEAHSSRDHELRRIDSLVCPSGTADQSGSASLVGVLLESSCCQENSPDQAAAAYSSRHLKLCSVDLHWRVQVAQPTSAAALALWAQESPLLPAEVPDEATAAAMHALGLPLSLSGADPPVPPFAAPFSGVVPFLLRLFRGYKACPKLGCAA